MNRPEDAIIAQSRKATQRLIAQMRMLPQRQRAVFIVAELARLDSKLPAMVEASIRPLLRKGLTADEAMERAIEVEAANALLNRLVRTGKESLSGSGLFGLGGLGASSAAKDVGNFALNLLSGAACSDGLRDLIVDKVGTGSGREAATYATAGAETLRGAVKCGATPAAAPAPATPAPVTPPAEPPSMPIWPFAVGGLALLGVVIAVKMRA